MCVVSMGVCVDGCRSCVHVCPVCRLTLGIFHNHSLYYFLSWSLSLKLGLTDSARLADQQALGIPLSLRVYTTLGFLH